jgi:hypothetical protein
MRARAEAGTEHHDREHDGAGPHHAHETIRAAACRETSVELRKPARRGLPSGGDYDGAETARKTGIGLRRAKRFQPNETGPESCRQSNSKLYLLSQ